MSVNIRPVEFADAAALAKGVLVQSTEAEVAASLEVDIAEMKKRSQLYLVAETDNLVVAQCSFKLCSSPIKRHLGEIFSLVVSGQYQGRGISSLLVKRGLEWFKGIGVRKALISVRKGTKAETVYRHLGFIEYGCLKDGIIEPWGNKDRFDEVLLSKDL